LTVRHDSGKETAHQIEKEELETVDDLASLKLTRKRSSVHTHFIDSMHSQYEMKS